MLRSLANFASRDYSMPENENPFPLYLLPSAPFSWRRHSSTPISTVSSPTGSSSEQDTMVSTRRQSNASTASSLSTSSQRSRYTSANLSKKYRTNDTTYSSDEEGESALNDRTQYLRCAGCQSDLCFATSVISKGFMGRHGRAYLLSSLSTTQITLSPPSSRPLVTGVHTVSDVSCKICGSVLGWKYIDAEQERQRYKVGKYILERERVIRVNSWAAPKMMEVEEDEEGREVEVPARRVGCGKGWEGAMERELRDIMESEDVDLSDEETLEEMFSGLLKPVGSNKNSVISRRV